MENKVFEVLQKFKALVENQSGRRIGCLQTDNRGGCTKEKFDSFCNQQGNRIQRTFPHTPKKNRVAERMNRTLIEMVRCMLHFKGCNTNFRVSCFMHCT